MKKFILILFLISESIISGITQVHNSDIVKIKQLYRQYNVDEKNYKKTEKNILGESTEAGKLIFFRDSIHLKIIRSISFGETGKLICEYYIIKEKPFFIVSTLFLYDGIDNSKVVSQRVNRYYLWDGKLIKWIDHSGKEQSERNLRKQQDSLLNVFSSIAHIAR